MRRSEIAATILDSLLGRFFRSFFADLFFDFAAPFAGEPRAKKAVKQIREKQNRRHPFIVHRGENEDDENDKKSRNRFLRFPIDRIETWILETAKHHEGKENQERRQN